MNLKTRLAHKTAGCLVFNNDDLLAIAVSTRLYYHVNPRTDDNEFSRRSGIGKAIFVFHPSLSSTLEREAIPVTCFIEPQSQMERYCFMWDSLDAKVDGKNDFIRGFLLPFSKGFSFFLFKPLRHVPIELHPHCCRSLNSTRQVNTGTQASKK